VGNTLHGFDVAQLYMMYCLALSRQVPTLRYLSIRVSIGCKGLKRNEAPQVGLEPTTLGLTATEFLESLKRRIAKEVAGVFYIAHLSFLHGLSWLFVFLEVVRNSAHQCAGLLSIVKDSCQRILQS
jgi:hypothetical protein